MQFERPLLAAGLVALFTGAAAAQSQSPEFFKVPLEHDSGEHASPQNGPEVVISFPVQLAGASWLRLYFEDVELAGDVLLGNGAVLRLTSWLDGDVQELNARQLEQWQNSSAYLNGDTVQVEVLAYPGTGSSRVRLRSADAGQPGLSETICGSLDNRVASSDPRVGRLLPVGCTGWLIDDCAGCSLTAGHCAGNISVMQFNVPLSNSNGSINNPPVADQYAIDVSSIRGSGTFSGLGFDWGYFGTFPNSTTGLRAAEAQGGTFVLGIQPVTAGATIRITGFGADDGTANQSQQTHVGPLDGTSGTTISYLTDTTGGNSGSPVIHEQTGEAVGIHTHGGCQGLFGSNLGTQITHPDLQAALANPAGVCSVAGVGLAVPAPAVIAPGMTTILTMEAFGDPVQGTQRVHFRAKPGELFSSFPMTQVGAGLFQVGLPAFDCGDEPEFYLSSIDDECGLVTIPTGAPVQVLRLAVGAEVLSLVEDFETNAGWTTSANGATAGQWERGVPVNDPNWAYDPAADADGSGQCYVTGNQLGSSDVDNGTVWLVSPPYDLSSGLDGVFYSYFLNLPAADGVDGLSVFLRKGSAGPWVLMARHGDDNALDWSPEYLSAADITAAGLEFSSTMQLAFVVNDTGFPNTVEAGIDAVKIGRLSCGLGDLGTAYCQPAVANSTGLPAKVTATGSHAVVDNSVELLASDVPVGQFGFFLASMSQGFQAGVGGSQGNLCLAGDIGRFNMPVLNSGAAGEMVQAVNLLAVPQPQGLVAVTAGQTWNFQLWFRDLNPGPTSNLSDALSVSFQ